MGQADLSQTSALKQCKWSRWEDVVTQSLWQVTRDRLLMQSSQKRKKSHTQLLRPCGGAPLWHTDRRGGMRGSLCNLHQCVVTLPAISHSSGDILLSVWYSLIFSSLPHNVYVRVRQHTRSYLNGTKDGSHIQHKWSSAVTVCSNYKNAWLRVQRAWPLYMILHHAQLAWRLETDHRPLHCVARLVAHRYTNRPWLSEVTLQWATHLSTYTVKFCWLHLIGLRRFRLEHIQYMCWRNVHGLGWG